MFSLFKFLVCISDVSVTRIHPRQPSVTPTVRQTRHLRSAVLYNLMELLLSPHMIQCQATQQSR